MEGIGELKTQKIPQKQVVAGLTPLTFKQVQEFKLLSGTDPTRYGQLGSPKWGNELHRFLADKDKRISREDVQRLMDTDSQVTDPLPQIRKSETQTEDSSEQLWSVTKRALRTCRYPEVVQGSLSSSPSSSAASDSQYSGDTIPMEDAPAPASDCNILESAMPNVSALTESSQSDQQTQNHSMPLDLSLKRAREGTTIEGQETSTNEEILKDIEIGFGALETLVNLSKKYDKIQPSFLPEIRKMYRKLEKLRKKNVSPKIPHPYLPEVQQEVETNPEYIEIDGDMDKQYVETVEDINLVTESLVENIMNNEAGDEAKESDLETDSTPGNIDFNIRNNQADDEFEPINLVLRESIPGDFAPNITDNESVDEHEDEDTDLEMEANPENINGNIIDNQTDDVVDTIDLDTGISDGNIMLIQPDDQIEGYYFGRFNYAYHFDFSQYPITMTLVPNPPSSI